MEREIFIVGITGGMASGKTTIANLVYKLGDCFCIQADQVSREVATDGHPCFDELVEAFGEGILMPYNQGEIRILNRKALRDLVFANTKEGKANKELLEKITHKHIHLRTLELFEEAKKENKKYVLWDVPLLFEVGWDKLCDEVVVVTCDLETRIARALQRDPTLTEDKLRNIIKAQTDDEYRVAKATYVIDNGAEVDSQQLEKLAIKLNNYLLNKISQQ
ncbi:dephospho-CoA kinase [Psittacicella hinzii]|uniref:Dephospho-CoA kinase n=1 Tax=Psittacicella hinzii TaxID=2028575 RepID=A0A3A1Y6T0_9GAMM|nr:dephospho-CoA kinase [Psittacicella hinzii]RIY33983.1 dephospho-CoA kinase [Psittacicella hinzii]